MKVSLNYCSQNGGNLYRDPYYNRNPNIGPRIDSNLGQSPNVCTNPCSSPEVVLENTEPNTALETPCYCQVGSPECLTTATERFPV